MAPTVTRPKIRAQAPQFDVHTYPILVSPQKAREALAASEYPFQRPLRPYQVAYLRTLIERRQLRPGTTVTFAVFPQTKQRYCINGRHTLTALGETTGQAYPLQFEEYLVETEEDVSRLYQSFDRNLPRSWKDLYRADTRLHQEDLPATVLEKLGGVTHLLATGFKRHYGFTGRALEPVLKNPYVRFALMYDWLEPMREWQAGILGSASGTRKILYRASVLAIALITYRFQPQRARTFWPRLARDSGLQEGEPEWTLLRYLREYNTRMIEAAIYQRTVASAWNFSFNHRPVTKLQPRKSGDPILILGTPHDGNAHYGYLGKDGTIYKEPRDVAEFDEEEPRPEA